MKRIIGYYRKCDLLTMTSICIAFFGVSMALSAHYTVAFLCLAVCGVCDAFDGKLARKGNYDKDAQTYGIQLDSLSDAICFGAFPALLTSVISPHIISKIICAFYLLCGVVRLAYFNTLAAKEDNDRSVFIGLPITTAAVAVPAVGIIVRVINSSLLQYILPAVLLILGLLFVLPIKVKKPDVGKIFKKIFNKYTVNFLIFPLFILLASDLYYKLNFGFSGSVSAVVSTALRHFLPFLFMLVYIAIAFFMITVIFGNTRRAKIFSAAVMIILLTVNDIKYMIMDLPLQLSDVGYLNPDNISMMGTAATSSIGSWIWVTILKSLVLAAACLVFILLDRRSAYKPKNIKVRLISIVLSAAAVTVPLIMSSNSVGCILDIYGVPWEECISIDGPKKLYKDYGLYQGMYLDEAANHFVIPENYSKEAADNAEAAGIASYTGDGSWGQANVVFILSETFTDLENMEEVSFSESLTPNIDSYENDSGKMVFDLLVSTFGGKSVNTEFEILSGSSLALWPSNYIPYNSFYNDGNGGMTPSLIEEFNSNGYETIYLTPWGRDSYQSEYIYGLYGADRTVYGDTLIKEESDGMILYSDMELMDDIYDELKDTSEGNYKFIMTATAENHFPYVAYRYSEYTVDVSSDTLNDEDLGMIRSYAQGIYNTDAALGYLYDLICDLDVPTIIVFYGDHLPYIVNSAGSSPYLDSAWFNTDDEYMNELREYTTRAVILANYELETEDLEYINASYLGAYVINRMDLEISGYYKFIDYQRTLIPVFNKHVFYLDGEVVPRSQASEAVRAAYNDQRLVMYRRFYDYLD